MPIQAESWAEMKIKLQGLKKAFENMPAPPEPLDAWSEKMNAIHYALEGAKQTVDSRMEVEDQ